MSKNEISHKFRGCNTSFWRKDFISVNGYNNEFKGWGREDSDLMIRLHNLGVKGKRVKFSAIVYHLDHDHHRCYRHLNHLYHLDHLGHHCCYQECHLIDDQEVAVQ